MNENKFSILLIEDNPDHISFQVNSLQKLKGIGEVVTACRASKAREILMARQFDLLILDYDLPDSDGLSFLESLKENNIEIPVIMVTGLGNERVAVRAMKLGAYDYIVKDRDYLKNLPEVVARTLEKIALSRSLKRIEKQLKESEERYQKLYENANSGFVNIDLKSSKFIKPNKKFLEMTGYSRSEIEQMEYHQIVAPEDKDRIVSYHKNRMAGIWGTEASPIDYEFWIITRNGERKYVSCTVAMFPQFGELFMTLNDITKIKVLEEKLREARDELEALNRQLQNKVNELQKQLIIEPILESPIDTEQKYDLDYGCSYLIKEKRPHKSYHIFKDFVSHGVFGLVITRTFPQKIQKAFDLEKTPMVWLSKREEIGSAISGLNLGSLFHTISEFVEKSQKSIVILDGIEFLITVNGFNRFISFMNDLMEVIMVNSTILLIPIHPDALEKKELAIIERYTEEVEKQEEEE